MYACVKLMTPFALHNFIQAHKGFFYKFSVKTTGIIDQVQDTCLIIEN